MHWLGRLPTTFGLCQRLKDQAWTEGAPWAPPGPLGTLCQEDVRHLCGPDLRHHLVPSGSAGLRLSFLCLRQEERTRVEKAARNLAKHVFSHAADAQVAS